MRGISSGCRMMYAATPGYAPMTDGDVEEQLADLRTPVTVDPLGDRDPSVELVGDQHEERVLVRYMVVRRTERDAELRGQPSHREALDPGLLDDLERGGDDLALGQDRPNGADGTGASDFAVRLLRVVDGTGTAREGSRSAWSERAGP